MTLERTISADELWEGEMRSVVVRGQRILLIRSGEKVFAYEDRCLHKQMPLSEGTLEDGTITCCAHHWQYDALTGQGLNPVGMQLKRFPVTQKDDAIYVEMGETRE